MNQQNTRLPIWGIDLDQGRVFPGSKVSISDRPPQAGSEPLGDFSQCRDIGKPNPPVVEQLDQSLFL